MFSTSFRLVSVEVALERTLERKTQVFGLLGRHLGQLGVDVVQVEKGNLLIEDLGKSVDTDGELAVDELLALIGTSKLNVLLAECLVAGLEQHDLGKDLVGEGARHDKRRVASGTAKVHKTTLGEEDDVTAVGHEEAVDLGLDVLRRGSSLLEPSNVNLDIEVTNVYE